MIEIRQNTVVLLEYSATLEGTVVSHTHKPKLILIGHERDLPPGLEAAIIGKTAPLELLAQYSYPAPEIEKIIEIPLEQLPMSKPEIGAKFSAQNAEGQGFEARVIKMNGNLATIDLNPPRAGKTLVYSIKIHAVRMADAHELEHGHAHGEGGVQHHHH